MNRRRATITGTLLVSASVSALLAATPALAQMPSWTGAYVGLNVGAAWGRSNAQASVTCPPNLGITNGYFCSSPPGPDQANALAVTTAGSGSLNSQGATGGFEAGYNWQTGQAVFGVAADFSAFNLSGSRFVNGSYPVNGPLVGAGQSFVIGNSVSTDWLFTARGRLGWAGGPNWLVFITGGMAASRVSITNWFGDATTYEQANSSSLRVGWTLGGGFEYALGRNWSVKVEYLYVNLGSVSTAGVVSRPSAGVGYSNGLGVTADLAAHVARAGFNFRF
jgi:outer membrane immunogenic protein